MQVVKGAAYAASAVLSLSAAGEARAQRFNVPPGPLGEVAAALGQQGGITIAVADPDLARRRSPGVRGQLPVREALARALRGTGARAVFYDRATVRIVRQRFTLLPKSRVSAPLKAIDIEDSGEIVVTASKQPIPLDSYPGSAKVVGLDRGWVASNAAGGTASLVKLLPSVGSTNLGPARDKLFIRGIADSSFNGPTQATVGQYLGDVRLNYNAPDPNLNLYDMKRIEVLVGPQGTLYGASSLGGVIRLIPNEPDANTVTATASLGISSTRSGGLGGDGAAMLNLPLVRDRVAFRLVTFANRQAGYIDDPSRRLENINSTVTYGQRAALRVEDLWGFTFDLGTATHNTSTRDGQYTLRGDPPLTRGNAISQPFKNTFYLTYLTGRRMLGSAELVTTTSLVRQDLRTIFDATGHDGGTAPARFEEDNRITLISHETRISGGGRDAPWVAGLSAIYNVNVLSRSLGNVDAPMRIAGVRNSQAESAIFGQLSKGLLRNITGTIGGRLTFASNAGKLLDNSADTSHAPHTTELRFSPTLALDWKPDGSFSAFLHFQQGYRAGGLAVAPSDSGLESRKFATDDLSMSELGIRLGNERDGLSARVALFYADWNNIQADLIDSAGLPFTTNIGSGRLYGLDGDITWRPSDALTITGAAFLNNSDLYNPAPEFATPGYRPLPNVARSGVRLGADWRREIAPDIALSGTVSLRYVGESRLGNGPLLEIRQGNYATGDLGARLDLRRFGIALDVANVGNARANSFAFGNPFKLAEGNQVTPLRPRTIRIGIDVRF